MKQGISIVGSFTLMCLASLLLSCNSSRVDNADEQLDLPIDTAAMQEERLVQVNKVTFSIPSPIQVAQLIEQTGGRYQRDLLHTTARTASYASKFDKAFNLGVFGADMGYCSIYDQSQDALAYLNATKHLADDLGISGGFDATRFERYKKALGKRDSMLTLLSQSYRDADGFLKENQRGDVGALILAGGWLESVHLMTSLAKQGKQPLLMDRIGQQKTTLDNLIKLLMPFTEQAEIASLIQNLLEVAQPFNDVELMYTYKPSKHDTLKNLTTIESESSYTISDAQLSRIAVIVEKTRTRLLK